MSSSLRKYISVLHRHTGKLVFLFLVLILIKSCWPMSEAAKMKIYHDAFNEAEYNNKIENHHKALEDFNAFIYQNIDIILHFKKVTHITIKGKSRIETIKERRKAVIFYNHMSNHIPPEIIDEFKLYWDNIGENLLKVVSIKKDRSFRAKDRNVSAIRYSIDSEHQSYEEPFYKERHIILYNDSLRTRDKIYSPLSSLVKEVYVGKSKDLKYYIEIVPHIGF